MTTKKARIKKAWVVYVLRCSDDTLYTGITNDIEKRFAAHNRAAAAKYTRSRLPVLLSAVSDPMSRADAMRLEIKTKKLPKGRKIAALKLRTKKSGNISKIKRKTKAAQHKA